MAKSKNFTPKIMSDEKPPRQLFARIIGRIKSEKNLATSKRKVLYFFVALGCSFVAFLLACISIQDAIVKSELTKILSLIFSDPTEIVANWSDFGLFVIESLPVVALTGFLISLLSLLWSLRYVVKYLVEMISTKRRIRRQLNPSQ